MANFETSLIYGESKEDIEGSHTFHKATKGLFLNRRGCLGSREIHIANTFNEIVEMDFADYGDFSAFLQIQDTFSRFSEIILRRGEEERRTNIGNGARQGDFDLVSGVWGARNYRGS